MLTAAVRFYSGFKCSIAENNLLVFMLPLISKPGPSLVLQVYLSGRSCLFDRNKHIKPGWAFLSKQSLWSAGWHGHCKYSRQHRANSAKVAALHDLPVPKLVCTFCMLAISWLQKNLLWMLFSLVSQSRSVLLWGIISATKEVHTQLELLLQRCFCVWEGWDGADNLG